MKNASGRGSLVACSTKAKELDRFGEQFTFLMPDGNKSKKTFQGCLVTLIASLILIFYAGLQLLRLTGFKEPQIMLSVRDSYYGTDFEFTSDDGLMIAFGLTQYDSNQEIIEDPTYGILNGYYKSWGIIQKSGTDFTLLPTTQCTRAQLGLPQIDGDLLSDYSEPPLFYPLHKNG